MAAAASSPSAVWLANPRWANGFVAEDSGREAIFDWTLAGVWSAMTIFICAVFTAHPLHDWHAIVVLIVMPAGAVFLLARAMQITLRRRRFGVSHVHLLTFPAAVGGQLVGNVIVPRAVRLENGLHLTLACIEREIVGSGKNAHAIESVLWQEEQYLGGTLPPADGVHTGTRIPVCFNISPHCHPCDDHDRRDRILWRLSAHAPMRWIDYLATFSLPVFKVAPEAMLADIAAEFRKPPPAHVLARGISRTSDAAAVEFRFAAARHPGIALQYTAFALAFAATPFLLWHLGVGTGMLIGFGIFFYAIALIIGVSAWFLWFSFSRIVARFDAFTLTRGQLFFARTRQFHAGEIRAIKPSPSLTAGSVSLYDLEMRTNEHPCIVITDGLSKRDAEQIAAELRGRLAHARQAKSGSG